MPRNSNSNNNNNVRKWLKPSKRAEGYAKERKAGVHQRGEKEGQELDEYNKGLRSGYLLAQSDNAGMYKYKKALEEGKTVAEARKISRQKGKPSAKKKEDKGAA